MFCLEIIILPDDCRFPSPVLSDRYLSIIIKSSRNHDYVEQAASPLYTFGYGLSYTTFEYSDLQVIRKISCHFEVSFKVKNTGMTCEEVAQLYLRDEYASVVQPLRQLKCFERFFLKRGEEKEIFFHFDRKRPVHYRPEYETCCGNRDFG